MSDSALKQLYQLAKQLDVDAGVYPLPNDDVCALDVRIVPGFKLHIDKDYAQDDACTLGLRIENVHVHDVRLTISGGHSKDSVAELIKVIAALQPPKTEDE